MIYVSTYMTTTLRSSKKEDGCRPPKSSHLHELNSRIFVYRKKQNKKLGQVLNFCHSSPRAHSKWLIWPQTIGPIVLGLQGHPGTCYICFFYICLDNIFKLPQKNQNLKEKFSNYFKINRYESNTHNTVYLFIWIVLELN